MYGLIALGFHVTYVVSSTVNFSQGSSVMLGAVLGWAFAVRLGWPMPAAFAASLLLCAAFGLLVERTLVRPFAARGSSAWLMATVAGGIVVDNAVLFRVHADMGPLFGIKAFAVAILGGIGSAPGVILAGLIYGLSEALITALFGSVYTQIAMFTVIIVALALLPQGLLGRAAVKKV